MQVEGLKGDDRKKGENLLNEMDGDEPIEMDDDFAADLEDVDRDERG